MPSPVPMSNEIGRLKMAFFQPGVMMAPIVPADEGAPHEQIGQAQEGKDRGRGDERRG
jgi:hypothetical protein